jgi:signal peptidase I
MIEQKNFLNLKFKAKQDILNVLRADPKRSSRRSMSTRRPKKPNVFFRILMVVILAFLTASIIRAFMVQIYFVPSTSMEPALMVGDRVLVRKLTYAMVNPAWKIGKKSKLAPDVAQFPIFKNRYIFVSTIRPQRSDIVIMKFPPKAKEPVRTTVKRIVGMSGEVIKIKKGVTYINGRAYREMGSVKKDSIDFGPYKVPANSYFVMGDNRASSSDSRTWGALPKENVIGIVLIRLWPFNTVGQVL